MFDETLKKAIADIDRANDALDALIQSVGEKDVLLSKKLSDVSVKEKELADRLKAVKDREEEVKKYGTIEAAHASLSKMKIDFLKDKQAVDVEKSELAKNSAAVDAKKKELDQLMSLYKSKIASVNKEHEELEAERKGLEAKIVAQFTKSLIGK